MITSDNPRNQIAPDDHEAQRKSLKATIHYYRQRLRYADSEAEIAKWQRRLSSAREALRLEGEQ